MAPRTELIIPQSFCGPVADNDQPPLLRYTLRTQACIATLRRFTKAAMSCLANVLKDAPLLYTLELALYEACSNVVRHAYDASEPGDVQIIMNLCPRRHITFEISDWGKGFDSFPVRLEKPPPEEEDGRGLLIIHGLADDFAISNNGNATLLRMRFIIEENKWRTCELQEAEADWS